MNKLVAITACLIGLAVLPASGNAAVLLPDTFVISNVDASGEPVLTLIDPGRRPAEVISSSAVGTGPLFSRVIQDVQLGPDRMLYVVDQDHFVFRVDPVTGNRTIVSDNSPSMGPPLQSWPFALDAAGRLYFAHGHPFTPEGVAIAVTRVDPVSGARQVLVDRKAARPSTSFGTNNIILTSDASAVIAMSDGFLYLADWALDRILQWRSFSGGSRSLIANPSGNSFFHYITSGGCNQPARIVEVSLDPTVPNRVIRTFVAPLDRAPTRMSSDDSGQLILLTTGLGGCGFPDSVASLSRLDPRDGSVELIHEFAGDSIQGTFSDFVMAVPSDYPFEDRDGDGVPDVVDKCPSAFDAEQLDTDGDGVGDACNEADDRDGDEYADSLDICPDDFDPVQEDSDGDGAGDACDPFPFDANNRAAAAEQSLREVSENLRICRESLPGDEDEDGIIDLADRCEGTLFGEVVDVAGCSIEQFCEALTPRRSSFGRQCARADWLGDDGRRARDCRIHRGRCVPNDSDR